MRRYFCEISGMTASCKRADEVLDVGICGSHEREKIIYKENTEQKMSVRIKTCGINKKPTFSCGLSTEWYFWKTPLKTVIFKI